MNWINGHACVLPQYVNNKQKAEFFVFKNNFFFHPFFKFDFSLTEVFKWSSATQKQNNLEIFMKNTRMHDGTVNTFLSVKARWSCLNLLITDWILCQKKVSVHFFQHLTTSGSLLSAEKPLQMELSSMTEQKPSGAGFPLPPPPPTRTVPLAREIQQT